jgi:hypothetical protein
MSFLIKNYFFKENNWEKKWVPTCHAPQTDGGGHALPPEVVVGGAWPPSGPSGGS